MEQLRLALIQVIDCSVILNMDKCYLTEKELEGTTDIEDTMSRLCEQRPDPILHLIAVLGSLQLPDIFLKEVLHQLSFTFVLSRNWYHLRPLFFSPSTITSTKINRKYSFPIQRSIQFLSFFLIVSKSVFLFVTLASASLFVLIPVQLNLSNLFYTHIFHADNLLLSSFEMTKSEILYVVVTIIKHFQTFPKILLQVSVEMYIFPKFRVIEEIKSNVRL